MRHARPLMTSRASDDLSSQQRDRYFVAGDDVETAESRTNARDKLQGKMNSQTACYALVAYH